MISPAKISEIRKNGYAAVILSSSLGALGVVRGLGKQGIPCIVIGTDFIRKSRFATTSLEAKTKEELISILLDLPKILEIKLALFTDKDEFLRIIYAIWDDLIDGYYLPVSKENVTLTEKEDLAYFTNFNGVKAPITFQNEEEIMIEQYPIIIKPLVHNQSYANSNALAEKAYICYQKKQLIETMNYLREIQKPFVIQQMIEGNVDKLYNILLYRSKTGKNMVGYVTKKIRVYPENFGVGTTIITDDQPQLVEESFKLMEMTNYVGIAEFEYKYCDKTKQFYLIEVNGRFPAQSGLLNKYNPTFIPDIFYDLIGISTEVRLSKPFRKMVWIYVPNDLRSFKSKLGEFFLTYVKLFFSSSVQDAVWSWRDPLPAFIYIKYLFKRVFEQYMMKQVE